MFLKPMRYFKFIFMFFNCPYLMKTVSNKVVVTRRPNWPHIFSGETITLTCEVQRGETTEWTYEWKRNETTVQSENDKDLTLSVSESSSGEYRCQCRLRDDWHSVTKWSEKIPLLVPVLPVTEGDPVTLSCRDKKQNLLSNVFFYHNDKLIHNDNRGELKISAVSKSDEGFYKCQHSGKYSPRMFLANLPAPVRSSSNVLVIIGLFSGILLIILLLFLCYYIRSKGETFFSSRSFIQHVFMLFYF
uniref:Ig-like domain-containing protein n=1 Tax=Poecilia reticulata TaxID=8081 RepID=A0A3P9N0K6_POERE